MRLYGSLRIAVLRLAIAVLAAALLAACGGAVSVVPDTADTDTFKIIDGKLYLFASPRARLYFEMDQERNLKLAWHYWESEVMDSNSRPQAWKRLVFRVPHFKSNAELAEEYEKRFGRKPG